MNAGNNAHKAREVFTNDFFVSRPRRANDPSSLSEGHASNKGLQRSRRLPSGQGVFETVSLLGLPGFVLAFDRVSNNKFGRDAPKFCRGLTNGTGPRLGQAFQAPSISTGASGGDFRSSITKHPRAIFDQLLEGRRCWSMIVIERTIRMRG